MVQYLNATADLHVGSWTTHTGATTNLWQQLDDVVPEEADYVQSEISPAGSVYVVASERSHRPGILGGAHLPLDAPQPRGWRPRPHR